MVVVKAVVGMVEEVSEGMEIEKVVVMVVMVQVVEVKVVVEGVDMTLFYAHLTTVRKSLV